MVTSGSSSGRRATPFSAGGDWGDERATDDSREADHGDTGDDGDPDVLLERCDSGDGTACQPVGESAGHCDTGVVCEPAEPVSSSHEESGDTCTGPVARSADEARFSEEARGGHRSPPFSADATLPLGVYGTKMDTLSGDAAAWRGVVGSERACGAPASSPSPASPVRLRCAGRRPVAGDEPGSERSEHVLMSAADAEVAAREVREPSGGSDEKSSILASCELPEAATDDEWL